MSVPFEGTPVRLGDVRYIVPALSLRLVRRYRGVLASLGELSAREPTDAEITQMVEVVHAALARNYPELTADQVEDTVDLNSLPRLMRAIAGQSGLEVVQPGEA